MRALCYVAEKDKASVTADEMVAALGIPRPFLRKLLQQLSSEGILKSSRGQGGGFALARKPGSVKLTELVHIFQGTVELNECVFKRKICPNRSTCKLKCEIDSIEQYVLDRLSRVSIGSLMNKGKGCSRIQRNSHVGRSHG